MKSNLIKTLFIFFSLFASQLFSQNISGIRVIGNINVEKGAIINSLAFKKGEVLTENAIALSIKNLYRNGMFDDVFISSEIENENLVVNVEVTELPIVSDFKIQRAKKIDEETKKELFTIEKGFFWSEIFEHKLIIDIKREYSELGYRKAKIEIEKNPIGDNHIEVKLSVNEGKPVLLKKINILGNREIKSKKILKIMKTKKNGWFSSGRLVQSKLDEDFVRIVEYYNQNGYIDAKVESYDVVEIGENELQLNIQIVEGEIFFFGDIQITGNSRFSTSTILDVFSFEVDEVFDKTKFDEQLFEVYNLYYEDGYIYVNINQQNKKVDGKINVELSIDENTRAKVRKIHIKGNRKTKEKVIRRKLAIYPGAYYKKSLVIASQQSLYNSGFFEPNISLTNRQINNEGDLDLFFNLTDKTSGTINGGIGFNSLDGFVGNFGVTFNNLLGNSWRTGVSLEFGASIFEYRFDFTNPYLFDSQTLGGFSIYNNTRKYADYNVKKYGGSLTLGRQLYFLKNLNLGTTYSFYSTKYDITDENDASSEVKQEAQKGWEQTRSLSLSLTRRDVDNIFFPSTGTEIELFSEYAGGPLSGDVDFFKQIYKNSWYIKLFWKFSLRTKWRVGYVIPHGNTKEVPPEEKFYVGGTGANGLRGYENLSLPKENEGGNRSIIFSNEVALPLGSDQIIGLLFFDAGDSYDHFEEFNFERLKTGTGLGMRFRTPMGLIGIDFGYNLSDESWMPHFQIGTTF